MTLPAALLDLIGQPGDAVREACVRVWEEYPNTERQHAVDTNPVTPLLAAWVAQFTTFALKSEQERDREIAAGTAEIKARAQLALDQNETKIADIRSERDQELARIDREIERLKKQNGDEAV